MDQNGNNDKNRAFSPIGFQDGNAQVESKTYTRTVRYGQDNSKTVNESFVCNIGRSSGPVNNGGSGGERAPFSPGSGNHGFSIGQAPSGQQSPFSSPSNNSLFGFSPFNGSAPSRLSSPSPFSGQGSDANQMNQQKNPFSGQNSNDGQLSQTKSFGSPSPRGSQSNSNNPFGGSSPRW